MQLPAALCPIILDSIPDHIAILDSDGSINSVNAAWKKYTTINGGSQDQTGVGSNYLNICAESGRRGNCDATNVDAGLRQVLEGKTATFSYEYPCHSPTQQQWFLFNCWPLNWKGTSYAVVSHRDITPSVLLREELRTHALTDSVTGVANRRHFDSTLGQEWRRDMRRGSPLSLVMLDIDYFKRFNDRYGHIAGDACLKRVAARMEEFSNRPGDLVARYGGEEFMLILGGTPLSGARQIAEKLCKAVRDLNIAHEASDISHVVTASLGVATMIPKQSISETEILLIADQALYTAKENGRNRVEVFRQ
jgi:diguanylate cyclase (GGDEF)-like protein